ncbi:hypothetical protein [Fischerella thermalis]|uniref:hypothetical protein n=1 Tax=Fischerella thermalis TaxID=372787 RepID=UPI0015E069ED|nr:hypothetical protein [Fischerella thermalis]
MKTLATSTAPSNTKPANYYDGLFDAAIALLSKSQDRDYQSGYLAKVRQTNSAPF